MRYDFLCNNERCKNVEEVVCSMSEYDTKKEKVRCPKCRHKMERIYTKPADGYVSERTIGHKIDVNTDRMSLDEKINIRLKALNQSENKLLKKEWRDRDKTRSNRIAIKQITEGHNS